MSTFCSIFMIKKKNIIKIYYNYLYIFKYFQRFLNFSHQRWIKEKNLQVNLDPFEM